MAAINSKLPLHPTPAPVSPTLVAQRKLLGLFDATQGKQILVLGCKLHVWFTTAEVRWFDIESKTSWFKGHFKPQALAAARVGHWIRHKIRQKLGTFDRGVDCNYIDAGEDRQCCRTIH